MTDVGDLAPSQETAASVQPSRGGTVARGAAILTLGQFLARGISSVWLVVVARQLGVSGFGIYALAFSFVGLVSVIADLGVGTILLREMSVDRTRAPELVGAALRIVGLLSVVAALVGVGMCVAFGYRGTVLLATSIGALSIIPNAITATASIVFQVWSRFDLMVGAILLNLVLGIMGGAVGLTMGAGPVWLMTTTVAAATCTAATSWIVALRYVHPRMTASGSLSRRLTRESAPLGVAACANIAAYRIDNLILAGVLGTSALGVYGVAFVFFTTSVELFHSPLVGTVFAQLPSIYEREGLAQLARVLRRTYGLILSLMAPVAIGSVVLAEPLLRAIFGERFADAATPLRLVVVASLATSYYGVLTKAMIVRRRSNFYMLTFVLLCVYVFVGSLVGVHLGGVTGLAAGVLAANVAAALTASVIEREIGSLLEFKRTLKITGCTVGMAVLVLALRQHGLAISAAAGVLSYVVLASVVGVFDGDDRKAVVQGLRRRPRELGGIDAPK